MPLVIGLDGGGSKTLLAAAARDGTVVACLRETGCNPFDEPAWETVLERLAGEAASLRAQALAVTLGLPGYSEVALVSAQQEAAAARFLDRPARVMNDVHVAFEAAFTGGPGVLLLAGTGSMAWASAGDGRHFRVGGWGHDFGDEGSAHWMGREAVVRASRAIDGRIEGRAFAAALFEQLGLTGEEPADALIGWYRSRPHLRSDLARLARFVDRQAVAGDPVAAGIIDEAAAHLAGHVAAARRALAGERDVAWSIAGGAFASARLRAGVAALVGTPFAEPVLPPLGGALLCAARDAGWTIDAAWLKRLKASLAVRMDADTFEQHGGNEDVL